MSATLILSAGDNSTRTIDNNETVFAIAGANDKLVVSAADTNVVFQGQYGTDTIDLTGGLAASYQVSQLGNNIVLTGNGQTITIPASSTGTSNITFSDGSSFVATYTGSSNVLTLGSQTVIATPT